MANKVSMEMVIPEHQTILEESSAFAQTVVDLSARVIKGADSVNIPTLAAVEGEDLALSGSFTEENNNYGDDILSITRKAGRLFSINVHESEQNVLNSLEDGLRESLKAMAKQLDRKLVTTMLAAATATGVARESSPANFYGDIVTMGQKMDEAGIPAEDRYLAVTPTDYSALLNTKDFVRFDGTGDGSAIKTGKVGEILGFTVVRSIITSGNGFTESFAYHKNAAVFAWQSDTIILSQDVPGESKRKYEVSRAYNCKALQSGALIYKWAAS